MKVPAEARTLRRLRVQRRLRGRTTIKAVYTDAERSVPKNQSWKITPGKKFSRRNLGMAGKSDIHAAAAVIAGTRPAD